MRLEIEHNSVSEDVKELFNLCFGQNRKDTEWSWKYQKSPKGFSASRCYDDDKLISQYGGINYSCFANDKEHQIFQIIDVMTHPKYRNGWTMIKTANKFFEYYCRGLNPLFLYGFTASASRKFHIKRLDYYSYTPIGYMQKKSILKRVIL